MPKTLFDKIWDAHAVNVIEGGPTQLYIDRHYCHEVTSPQAFDGLRRRGLRVFRPGRTVCSPDHNIPTKNQDKPIADPVSRNQVETLNRNAAEFGLDIFGIGHERNGIIHVIGPENGLTLPGYTIVCGDSHTSTHGAFGAVAFGIGTSEVEMVLASQCILQPKPKSMRITVDGHLRPGVTAKDVALYIISRMTTSGATGYFVEYAGEVVRDMSMEERMTLCNLSIEMGARGGMVAPDETTFAYLKGRDFAPKDDKWDEAVAYWRTLPTDDDAVFDAEVRFDAADIEPRVTFGTNPGMGIGISEVVPRNPGENDAERAGYTRALRYMGFEEGEKITGTRVDYVFVGSCTNGRFEDFRLFAEMVKGRKKAPGVIVWLVPGSRRVLGQIRSAGLDRIFAEAGFELREPGCSACLAMNDDKVAPGRLCVSTSNRNFEGRQGPGSRTVLAGVPVAAAAALTGYITDPRTL
ncbi:3-isopropylmalate dehydratase large subunit [Muribaculum intestinale]|uniref:3-isopropylmalate dehydratase large subunit n=1 Tax=Muribaculum intestinale TaxID=1796646 RepID=UPI00243061A1|nr:3-isopropylmalate dehydratase large subunit [Muribaculum intestinale]